MSNPLSVRRVKFQNLNEDGTPDGKPSYGIIASDNEKMRVNNSFESFELLNAQIEQDGCILDLVGGFDGFDRKKVSTANFYGKDWMKD